MVTEPSVDPGGRSGVDLGGGFRGRTRVPSEVLGFGFKIFVGVLRQIQGLDSMVQGWTQYLVTGSKWQMQDLTSKGNDRFRIPFEGHVENV